MRKVALLILATVTLFYGTGIHRAEAQSGEKPAFEIIRSTPALRQIATGKHGLSGRA